MQSKLKLTVSVMAFCAALVGCSSDTFVGNDDGGTDDGGDPEAGQDAAVSDSMGMDSGTVDTGVEAAPPLCNCPPNGLTACAECMSDNSCTNFCSTEVKANLNCLQCLNDCGCHAEDGGITCNNVACN